MLFPLLMVLVAACSTDHTDRVLDLQKAMNAHNSMYILSFFTDDVSFKVGGYYGTGIDELKKITEWDSVLSTSFTFSDFRVAGDSVICKCSTSNELMSVMGIEKGIADPVIFVFHDGLISHMAYSLTQEDQKKDQDAWRSFMAWADTAAQKRLEDLMPEGKFVIDGRSASGWLEAFRAWRTTE